jgi:YYY domain-containing protein
MEFGAVARWLVVLALLAALGLPLAARLFDRLDGRGVGLALPLAFATAWWGAYLVGQVTYGPHASLAGLALLALVAAAASLDVDVHEGSVGVSLPGLDRAAARQVGSVFLAAFALLVAVRALDPSVFPLGGEKFLDYGMLEALSRADRLPPEDFWFAGERVAYYYGGHLLAATLGDFAGTGPRLTYNLALATAYAALVAAVYDLGAAMGVRRGLDRRVTGGTAAVLVGLSANLAAALDVALVTLPDAVARPVAGLVAGGTGRSAEAVLREAGRFNYFEYSRVIPGTINEFPLFAWLNGDLHAHMTSTPFLALVVGLAFAYSVTPAAALRRRRLLAFVCVPVVAGLLAVVNTWSFPTAFGVLWLALALAPTDPLDLLPRAVARPLRTRLPDGPARELLRPLLAALPVVVAGAVACVLAAPFVFGTAAGTAGSRSVAVLAPGDRSGLGGLLLVHGVFLAAGWTALVAETRGRTLPLAGGLAVLAAVAFSLGAPVLLVVSPLILLGWAARRGGAAGFEAVLFVAGAGLVTVVEFVYLVEQAGPLRMNTVFKTYSQVWVLWGLAAGVAGPAVVARVGGSATDADARDTAEAADGAPDAGAAFLAGPPRRRLATVLALLVLCSTLVYGAQALPVHVDAGREDPTLDARAFVGELHPDAVPALAHLDGVDGTPTMLSAPATSVPPPGGSYPAPPGMYDWTSSPGASMTGVPTVAGWHHEVGYRGREAYVARARAADEMYRAAPERRVELMRAHDVRYVWVGEGERARYGSVSFAGIAGVDPVVETGGVTLYRVDQSELAVRTQAVPRGEITVRASASTDVVSSQWGTNRRFSKSSRSSSVPTVHQS